jgi:NAD(P)-dependent dehydrogenase (short-subunit alcohol dehydrogenase family)
VTSASWPEPFPADLMDGRVCLVTGAARGIGAGIARRLSEHGGAVAVTDVDEAGAASLAAELREAGASAASCALDVRDTAAIDAAVAAIEGELGPVDVLVNNAGLFELTESVDVPDPEWELQIGVMLTGPFKLARRLGRDMLRRGEGAIVGTCSIGGFGGHPQRTAYNAAKGGLRVMTEVLATEWAARGVRVNAVAPAVTRTEILTGVLESGSGRIKADEFAERTPLGRIAESGEIADSVLFLSSALSSYVTGEVLAVDGGWLASDGFPHPAQGDPR